MNPRSTGILAIVAAVLGAFIYFYEVEGAVDRKAAEEAELLVFPGLDPMAIESIELETQDGRSARFVRDQGSWNVVEPVDGPADSAALESMASVLAQLARKGRVADPGPLSDYGLDTGARSVRFDAEGAAQALRIGRDTPVGGHIYVARLDSSAVDYVETFRLNAFNRNLADLRDRRVAPFETGDASSISLRWPGSEVELELQNQSWTMTSPAQEPADEPTVRTLLTDLSLLSAKSFVDSPHAEVEATFASPALEIQVATGDEFQRVVFGGELDGERLTRGPDGRLFTIAPERFADFERSVSAYRYRTLSEFDIASARGLELEFAANESDLENESLSRDLQRVTVSLGERGWAASDISVDPDRVEEMVRELSQLRANSVLADGLGPDELASFGLAPPNSRIRVLPDTEPDSNEEILAEVLIGHLNNERGLYAQRGGDSKIYLLDPDIAASIPISWEALEARFLAPVPGEDPDWELPEGGSPSPTPADLIPEFEHP